MAKPIIMPTVINIVLGSTFAGFILFIYIGPTKPNKATINIKQAPAIPPTRAIFRTVHLFISFCSFMNSVNEVIYFTSYLASKNLKPDILLAYTSNPSILILLLFKYASSKIPI